jgi:hypothetical protein
MGAFNENCRRQAISFPGYFQMPGGGGNQLSLDRQFTILCTGFDELQQIVNAIEAQARKIHEAAPAPAAPQAFG